jgi:hypothetical protein
MEQIRIKNIRALELIGPADESKIITEEIADMLDRLHEIRVKYDPSIWSPEGSRSSDSSVIKILIGMEINEYERKIQAREI